LCQGPRLGLTTLHSVSEAKNGAERAENRMSGEQGVTGYEEQKVAER